MHRSHTAMVARESHTDSSNIDSFIKNLQIYINQWLYCICNLLYCILYYITVYNCNLLLIILSFYTSISAWDPQSGSCSVNTVAVPISVILNVLYLLYLVWLSRVIALYCRLSDNLHVCEYWVNPTHAALPCALSVSDHAQFCLSAYNTGRGQYTHHMPCLIVSGSTCSGEPAISSVVKLGS